MRFRKLPTALVAMLTAFSALMISSATISGSSRPLTATAVVDSSANCPGGSSQCETFTPTGCSQDCFTVVAGPTVDVSSPDAVQYVYLDLSNFPAGDSARIAYCQTSSSGKPVQLVPDPECGFGTYSQEFDLSTINTPIGADGTAQASFPVPYAPPGSEEITGLPVVPGPAKDTFLCDNGPDYCALEVTDDGPGTGNGAQDPDDTSSNTVVIPLTYFTGADGCPGSDPLLQTDSSYSAASLIPAAVDSTCTESTGVVALNTQDDSESTISDFASGGADLAFTDDPADPVAIGDLAGKSVAYIPVGLSAAVFAYLGWSEDEDSNPFALDQYQLTPDMVAGILDSVYSSPNDSDLIVSQLNSDGFYCDQKNQPQIILPNGSPCGDDSQLDAFDYLNPLPSGIIAPTQFGAFMPEGAMGSSAEITDWVCNQANKPFNITVTTEPPTTKKDKKHPPPPTQTPETINDASAVSTLTDNPGPTDAWSGTGAWPYASCGAYHLLPTLGSAGSQYSMDTNPVLQAKDIRSYAYGGGAVPLGGTPTRAAFGIMDWSEAAYNGLNVASLQNASGAFVTPSSTSILAALKDATPCPATGSSDCPAGTYVMNYTDTSNSGAYPMPLITYAVVPTHPTDHDTGVAIKDFLTSLVNYSHSGGSLPLPPGYVSLPDSLYNQAMTEISSDITVPPAPPSQNASGKSSSGHSGASKGGSSGSGAVSDTAFGPGAGDSGSVTGDLGQVLDAELVHAQGSDGGGSGGGSSRLRSDVIGEARAVLLGLLAGAGRWKYVLLFAAAAVALLVGPALIAFPELRKRLRIPKLKKSST